MKPLRYDARSAASFPNVLLLDTGAKPTPLHVVSASLDPQDRAAKEKALKAPGDTGMGVETRTRRCRHCRKPHH